MAILKNFDLQGLVIEGAYWRIGSFYCSTIQTPVYVDIRLDCYVSEQAYQEGRRPLSHINRQIELDLSDAENPLTALFAEIRSACYSSLKATPEFEDGVDA